MYESLPPEYHDTKLWSPDLQSPPSAPMSWHRRRSVQTLAAALLGLLVGLAADLPHDRDSGRDATLERQYTAAVADRDEAQQELRSAESRLADGETTVRAEQARLTTEADQLAAEAQRLGALAEELTAREAALTAREAAAAANVAQPRDNAHDTPPDEAASAYYGSCSEARAAGAAPVHAGDPGYGGHLDRDGDGVGCE